MAACQKNSERNIERGWWKFIKNLLKKWKTGKKEKAGQGTCYSH